MLQEKLWYLSKLNWVGMLTFVSGLLAWLIGQDLIADHPQLVSALTMLLGFIVFVLRTITKQPVTFQAAKGKWCLIPLAALLMIPGTSYAQDRQYLNITGLPAGDYHLRINSDGSTATVPFRLIEIGSTPPPIDPGDPTPTLSRVGQTVFALCRQYNLDKATVAELSAIYEAASSRTDASLTAVFETVRGMTDALLAIRGKSQEFAAFREDLTNQVNTPEITSGRYTHATFAEVAEGMSAHADEQAISADKIIRVFMMVLDTLISGERLTIQKIIEIMVALLGP